MNVGGLYVSLVTRLSYFTDNIVGQGKCLLRWNNSIKKCEVTVRCFHLPVANV